MRWTKYTIQTTTKDADMVSAVLMDYGINDVQIENNVQLTDEELNQMYADFVKELPPDDGSCSLSFYMEFEDGEDRTETNQMLDDLVKGLDEAVELYGIEPVELICEDLNSGDWENNWKEFFKPFTVDNILIAPTWEEIPEDTSTVQKVEDVHTFVHTGEDDVKDVTGKADAAQNNKDPEDAAETEDAGDADDTLAAESTTAPEIVIRIDPGMAFGTGTHETTRLCLRALQKYMQEGDKVLDLGCGSGILGIAAMKLGAACAVSVDIDEQAVKVAEENFEINEVDADQIRFYVGNVVDDEDLQKELVNVCGASANQKDAFALNGEQTTNGLYDIVTVNILADVINVMMPTLDMYLKEGGILITSGILNEKEQLIRDAIAANPNLTLVDVQHDGDWVSIVAKHI